MDKNATVLVCGWYCPCCQRMVSPYKATCDCRADGYKYGPLPSNEAVLPPPDETKLEAVRAAVRRFIAERGVKVSLRRRKAKTATKKPILKPLQILPSASPPSKWAAEAAAAKLTPRDEQVAALVRASVGGINGAQLREKCKLTRKQAEWSATKLLAHGKIRREGHSKASRYVAV